MNYTIDTLKVYQLAEIFSDKIWFIVEQWDFYKRDTVGKQLVRAADSISANIAEGYGRHFFKERKQFYFFARGSLLETKSWLSKCERRKLITHESCMAMIKEAEDLLHKLNAYIKFVVRSQQAENTGKKEANRNTDESQ